MAHGITRQKRWRAARLRWIGGWSHDQKRRFHPRSSRRGAEKRRRGASALNSASPRLRVNNSLPERRLWRFAVRLAVPSRQLDLQTLLASGNMSSLRRSCRADFVILNRVSAGVANLEILRRPPASRLRQPQRLWKNLRPTLLVAREGAL